MRRPLTMGAGGPRDGGLLDVLLVDDDPNDLALFGLAVEKADLNIWLQTATSAKQAIEYLEGTGKYADRGLHPVPDMVLLDLIMPEMSGFDFLGWRKRSSVSTKVPVMVLSGLGDERQIEGALTLGADGYFPKPAAFEGWVELVRTVWNLGVKHTR